jgi:hypothetical protein
VRTALLDGMEGGNDTGAQSTGLDGARLIGQD